MNCITERITFLIILMAVVIATPSHKTSRQINTSTNVEDRFPNRPTDGGQFPNPNPPDFPKQNQGQNPNGNTGTTEQIANEGGIIYKPPCNCPTIGNFNPVCGSNNKTYANPSVLNCHSKCGVVVQMIKMGTCTSNRS